MQRRYRTWKRLPRSEFTFDAHPHPLVTAGRDWNRMAAGRPGPIERDRARTFDRRVSSCDAVGDDAGVVFLLAAGTTDLIAESYCALFPCVYVSESTSR